MKLGLIFLAILISLNSQASDYNSLKPKDCTVLREACFAPDRHPENPFFLRSSKSNRVALLIHGYTDSPYTMKDMALFLNDQGYNVYAPLLSGHGSIPEAMVSVSRKDWIKDAQDMLQMALQENSANQALVVGFSMGGAVAAILAEEFPEKVSALVLFAPAFQLLSGEAQLLCGMGIAEDLVFWARNEEGSTRTNYQKMSTHGLCELNSLAFEARRRAVQIKAPVFTVLSQYDQNINNYGVLETIYTMPSQQKEILFFTDSIQDIRYFDNKTQFKQVMAKPLVHSDLIFKEDSLYHKRQNPRFDFVTAEIETFLNSK
jgi:esterase/lipase